MGKYEDDNFVIRVNLRGKGNPNSPPRYTVEEYLALERSSEERYEFLDGQVYLMAGESQ